LSVLFLDRNGEGTGTGHFCPAEQKIPA